MKKNLKLLYVIFMFAFFVLSVYSIFFISYILSLFNETKVELSNNVWVLFVFPAIFGSLGILYFIFEFYKIIKNTIFLNYTKYAYEEYKAIMDKKKAEKQERKKQKLQQQLNELEKGD